MGVTVCKCRKCGKYHVFENFGVRDAHICECGERLGRWEQQMYDCEIEKKPNEPYERKHEPIRNDMLAAMTYAFRIHNDEATQKRLCKEERWKKANPAFAFIDDNQKVNAIPFIATGSKLVFTTTTPHRREDREELAKEYTDKLGIKCEVIDARTELVAVIDG